MVGRDRCIGALRDQPDFLMGSLCATTFNHAFGDFAPTCTRRGYAVGSVRRARSLFKLYRGNTGRPLGEESAPFTARAQQPPAAQASSTTLVTTLHVTTTLERVKTTPGWATPRQGEQFAEHGQWRREPAPRNGALPRYRRTASKTSTPPAPIRLICRNNIGLQASSIRRRRTEYEASKTRPAERKRRGRKTRKEERQEGEKGRTK